jgi:hypothetical protein
MEGSMATQQRLLVGTRIIDFNVSPTRVAVGETITITGTLQWHLWPFCWWYPLEGKIILIIADSVKVGEALSGSDGKFRFLWTPTNAGVYWVKAHFPGDLTYNGCDSQTIKVEVITPEQKQQEQMQFYTTLGVVIAGVVGVVALVVHHIEEEKRLETLIAMRRR